MAEKRSIRFKGHETFTLREGWLNKGLTAIAENPHVFRENYGADALGMGPNMAKALRYWLRCAGLAEDIPKRESKEGGMRLSPVGRIVFEGDRYIEDIFTLWLIHCRIAANYSQATACRRILRRRKKGPGGVFRTPRWIRTAMRFSTCM